MGLIDLLPEYYAGSAEVAQLQGALQYWSDLLWSDREDVMAQANVETATWGLKLWEKMLGLDTDVSKADDYRRTRIMSKLRGKGTTTTIMIQNVAESFSNGEVAIIEHNDEYRFEIKFVGTLGLPPNMDDLNAAIEDIKPAHLACSYIFIFITWEDVETYNHTWGEWDTLNLTWDAFETYKEG